MSPDAVHVFEGSGWVCSAGPGVLCTERDGDLALRFMAVLGRLEASVPADECRRLLLDAFKAVQTPVASLAASVHCADGLLLFAAGTGRITVNGAGGTQVITAKEPELWAIDVVDHGTLIETRCGSRLFEPPIRPAHPSSAVVSGSGFRLAPRNGMVPSSAVDAEDDATVVRTPENPVVDPDVAGGDPTDDPAVMDQRPILCVVRFSDGQSVDVRRSVVVGRDPRPTSHDGRRECDTVTVASPDKVVSRNHFEIGVVDGGLMLIDRGSHNGTRLRRPGSNEVSVDGGASTELRLGDIVAFADMTAQVQYPPAEPPG